MNDEPKFIVADRPVNRRTALRGVQAQERARQPAPPRVLALQARNRLGPPLAHWRAAAATRPQALPPLRIAGAVVAACGGVGLFLGWLQGSMLAAAGAAAATVVGLALLRRRGPSGVDLDAPQPQAWVDEQAVAAFDRAIEALAGDLPAAALPPLQELKERLLRILRHPAANAVDEHFRLEDRHYVNECLHRYLPDSLQAYVAVPAAQRRTTLAGGQTPEDLLLAQLALLARELARREAALGRSAAEALLRQERFLKAKAGP